MSAPKDKVRKLIALAVGTNSLEEARTTALIAVRLIAEHKMLDAVPSTPFFDFTPFTKPSPRPNRRPAPEGCAWIKARFDSTCIFCSEATRTGESVLWEKGNGVIHEACYPAAYADAQKRGTL